jgi:EAL domain-containing protein (putative c-di-GMP-specific phosphodiesterase class I)
MRISLTVLFQLKIFCSMNMTFYPVNRLKIAQELVFRVNADARSATVVRAAVRLANELDIDFIAEGVEDPAQATFLVAAGCRHAQGFYFSRPVDAEQTTALLRRGKVHPAETPKLVDATAA